MARELQIYNFVTQTFMIPAAWQLDLKVGDCYAIETPTVAVGEPGNFKTFDNLPTVYGQIESAEDCEPGFFWAR